MTRNLALSIVTGAWALQNPDALRDWALRVPPGEKKDAALAAAMRGRGGAPPDPALLGSFSDDRARQAALMNTILATAQTDPGAARRLLDAHITDPRMRTQAEQMIDGFARGAVPLPTGGFGVATGVINGQPPFAVGGTPAGVVYGPLGQPATIIGPNGQPTTIIAPNGQPATIIGPDGRPIMLRSPVTGQPVQRPVFAPPGQRVAQPPPQ